MPKGSGNQALQHATLGAGLDEDVEPCGPDGGGQAVCLEVKSSGGEGFHLTSNE